MLSPAQYQIERAVCDKADAYWKANATHGRNGSSMSKELVAHPDYAACDNAMRSRVEAFELNRDKPESFDAYISKTESGMWFVSTWMGDKLSTDLVAGSSYHNPRRSYTSDTITPIRVKTLCGDWYAGRALGAGLHVRLRKIKTPRNV